MVFIEQIYTGCLAQGAYYVQSGDEALIIDPLRDVNPYVVMAEQKNAKIKYVFETHFHADFVSGHVELASKTGAAIVFGPMETKPKFDLTVARDGEVFTIGKATITVLHTPGHTLESSCFLLKDEDGKEVAVFTGDTLFIGDVGRPDLAASAENKLTKEDLARMLYRSLWEKIVPLPDHITVYPGHGAGSPCGKSMSKENSDTLGNQKKVNYALQPDLDEDNFVQQLTTGLPIQPSYFATAVAMNKGLNEEFATVLAKGDKPLTPAELDEMMQKADAEGLRIAVLDTRDATDFMAGFIPHTVFLGIDDGTFGPWGAAALGDVDTPIVIIPSSDGRHGEAVTRMSRFGFSNFVGFLQGGFDAWKAYKPEAINTITSITAEEVHAIVNDEAKLAAMNFIDCRNPGEQVRAKHGKCNYYLPLEARSFEQVDTSRPTMAYCRSGYRSVVFVSMLMAFYGLKSGLSIIGGFDEGLAKCSAHEEHIVRQACPLSAEAKCQSACTKGAAPACTKTCTA